MVVIPAGDGGRVSEACEPGQTGSSGEAIGGGAGMGNMSYAAATVSLWTSGSARVAVQEPVR
jgi:hypothetical protein